MGLAPHAVRGQTTVGNPDAWTPPRTAAGHPDLQGVWVSRSATPLERPESLAGRELLTDEEVAELQRRADLLFSDDRNDFAAGDNLFLAALGDSEQYDNPRSTCGALAMLGRQFDNRTALIIDPPNGRMPPRTPAAEQRLTAATAMEMRPDGPGDLSTWVRCLTRGLPRLGGTSGAGIYGYYQIFQTDDHVALVMETIHDARIIPLDGRPPLANGIRQWHGDSRGRWEGDTLVVETANFSSVATVMGSDRNLHLVERFTRVADDTISYEVTIRDPTAWTAPWTVRLPLTRTDTKRFTSSPATRAITTACWASWPVRGRRIGWRPRVAAERGGWSVVEQAAPESGGGELLAAERRLAVGHVERRAVARSEQDAGAVLLDLDDVVHTVAAQQCLDLLRFGERAGDVDAGHLVVGQSLGFDACHGGAV
jgi:hypothetical protein